MNVVILCGGQGTRLREETEFRPKPMVEIGGRPILWHIMKIYAHFGLKDFILCLGYKGYMIKGFFQNYETRLNAMTGARVRRIRRYLDDGPFCLTYGDGVGNIDVARLIEYHKSHGKIGTVTGVRPPGRFGELRIDGRAVTSFAEKVQMTE